VQYPGLQGGGALGDAWIPGKPAGSMAASTHGGTCSHVPVAGGCRAGKGVPPPSPRQRRPAGVVQRLPAGPSHHRAAHLRAADKAHGPADAIDHRATGRLSSCREMALETADVPPQQKPARRHDYLRVIAGASNPESRCTRSPRAPWGGGGGQEGRRRLGPVPLVEGQSFSAVYLYSLLASSRPFQR